MSTKFPLDPTQYTIKAIIGRGTYSKVYKAICKTNNLPIVVKIINLEEYPLSLETIQKQTAFWSKCSHPNIVAYYGSFVDGPNLWILTEYMSGGSVSDVLKFGFGKGIKDESIVATILSGVVNGLRYLHENREIHRDVRSGNILISANGEVKLSDFGLATSLIQEGHRKSAAISMYGDACYMAPEILTNGAGYSEKTDVWSLGLTAIELATGKMPFEGMKFMESMAKIISSEPPELPKEGHSLALRDFVSQCLKTNPEKRASTKDLVDHKFLKLSKGNGPIVNILSQLAPLPERYKVLHGEGCIDCIAETYQSVQPTLQFDFDINDKPEEQPQYPPQQQEPVAPVANPEPAPAVPHKVQGRFTITRQNSKRKDKNVDDLRNEIAELEKTIAGLEAENDDLKNKISQITAAVKAMVSKP